MQWRCIAINILQFLRTSSSQIILIQNIDAELLVILQIYQFTFIHIHDLRSYNFRFTLL